MSLKPKSKKRNKRTEQRRYAKLAKNEQDLRTHFRKVGEHGGIIIGVDVSGPLGDEFWVDVKAKKRGAWNSHTVAEVKKEMKKLIPKAKYDGFFNGSKDRYFRVVYFKVPVNAEMKGIHYENYEMDMI